MFILESLKTKKTAIGLQINMSKLDHRVVVKGGGGECGFMGVEKTVVERENRTWD